MKSRLPDLMKEKNINYYKLIEITGLSKQTVTRARGDRIRHCTLETLEKIALALGVNVSDLFDDSGK